MNKIDDAWLKVQPAPLRMSRVFSGVQGLEHR
jgi:hypothetical protein